MSGDDPIFAALERWKSADREFGVSRNGYKDAQQNHGELGLLGTRDSDRLLMAHELESERLCAKRNELLQQLYQTMPTTLNGLSALVQVFTSEDLVEAEGLVGTAMSTICHTILSLTETPR